MNRYKIYSIVVIGIFAVLSHASALPIAGIPIPKPTKHKRLAEGCTPATAAVELNINNVRARILNGGDMWWDLSALARYEVPKVTQEGQPRKTSLFAGSLWIGGFDHSNLKEAAMTYRQNGSDFFPGPLDTSTGSISADQCLKYDRIWQVNKTDVDNFRAGKGATADMTSWPAHPIDPVSTGQAFAYNLAPYKDVNGDGRYDLDANDPQSDYPTFIAHTVHGDCEFMPDQNLWFVYNDKGNTHNETKSLAIGLEVQMHCFAFVTNDQLNSATFYASTIINRGVTTLDSTFFGQWVDPDLGYAFDDYVAVDTTRSLGICYNGDNNDDGALGYGKQLPAIGVDFFLGPKADDPKKDNNKDGKIDEYDKFLPMSNFVYYNNDFNSVNGNPEEADDYYYYLTARWKQGAFIHNDGKNGTGGGARTHYMFPGDPRSNNPENWTEKNAGNPPGDRRFLQSAGPFKLKPGAVNYVTTGVVWAQSSRTGDNTDAITELLFADDLAQSLYDDCFQLRIGPEPPVVNITELDRKIILSFIDKDKSISKTEKHIKVFGQKDTMNFEGYIVYQLVNSSVSAGELSDASKARVIAQVDVKNGIGRIINNERDAALRTNVPVLKVDGADNGIKHTFEITNDVFASSSDKLVNNRFYYYMVVAYGYIAHPGDRNTYFLAGRPSNINGVFQLQAIPHKTDVELGGTSLNADFGTQVALMRTEGIGNGGNVLDLAPESVNQLFGASAKNVIDSPLYIKGAGPVGIRVYDPLKVPSGDFTLKIFDSVNNKGAGAPSLTKNYVEQNPIYSRWVLTSYDKTKQKLDTLAKSLDSLVGYHEQVIPQLGMVVSVNQVLEGKFAGLKASSMQLQGPAPIMDSTEREQNGFLQATMEFADPTNTWLSGVIDAEQSSLPVGLPYPNNWIRSGKHKNDVTVSGPDDHVDDVEIGPDYTPGKNSQPEDKANVSEKVKTAVSVVRNTFRIVAKGNIYVYHPFGAATSIYYGTASGKSYDTTTSDVSGLTVIRLLTGLWDTVANTPRYKAIRVRSGDTLFIDSSYVTYITKTVTHTISYNNFVDPKQVYEGLLGGIIAPAGLAARSDNYNDIDLGTSKRGLHGQCLTLGPLPNSVPFYDQRINNLHSVDIVFTSDRSKWSKTVVFEMGENELQNEGGAKKFELRKHTNPFTVGSDGLPTYNPGQNSEIGTSWFPGYAVDIETGERLNIMFGEDSHLPSENGDDMLWNPTNHLWQANYQNGIAGVQDYQSRYFWGGKHWIYVMGASVPLLTYKPLTGGDVKDYPAFAKNHGVPYDGCATYYGMLHTTATSKAVKDVFTSAAWVMPSTLSGTGTLLSPEKGFIPTETKIRLRVAVPYASYAKAGGNPENANQPVYKFNTSGIVPTVNAELGKKALELVNIVPNPYYAYSAYETSQLDNRVRLTNLPRKCTVDIYTVDGSLVRRFKIDQPVSEESSLHTSYLDWDLKNNVGVPVASGVYLIHINAGELGERVIKWFGVMRPIDLDTF